MFKKENSAIYLIPLYMITSVVVFYILYIGSGFIIDFIIALLFSFAIIALSNFYQKFKLPSFIAFIFSIITYIFIFWLIVKMVGSNVKSFIKELPVYQGQIIDLVHNLFNFLDIEEPKSLNEVISKLDIQKIFNSIFDTITSIFSSAWIIMFYVMFLLLEHRYFKNKLNLMIKDTNKRNEVFTIVEKIRNDIKSYFVIKVLVSFVTWFLSYLAMISFWLDYANFFAFCIFLLNFIPSVWSITAVWLVFIFSFIWLDSYYDIAIMWSLLIWIQVLMWNIIEPKFMWNKLNLSPLVIILALWFWWIIWGVVGMLLSVPIMVIINIVFAKIPATRPMAILMSEKWELQVDWWEEVIKHRRRILRKVKEKFVKK